MEPTHSRSFIVFFGGFGETNNNYGGFSVLRPSFAFNRVIFCVDSSSLLVVACRCLSLLVVACRCLSLLVVACRCLSLLVLACPCLSLLVLACPCFSLLYPLPLFESQHGKNGTQGTRITRPERNTIGADQSNDGDLKLNGAQ
jgi:hypothetical protein